MWNWKLLYEDEEIICYCDIDSIVDPEEDENGLYSSVECYQSIPKRVAAWMSFFFKNKEAVRRYLEQREKMGISIDGYEDFNNVLCVAEIDSEKRMYRVIPAIDYDSEGKELSQSAALHDEGKALFKGGMRGDWSPIQPRKTHRAIHALFKFVYL